MKNPICIPSQVLKVFGGIIEKHDIKPDLVPLTFSFICLQELYIQNIVHGISEIDRRMLKVVHDSLHIELNKLCIDPIDIEIRENFENLRYKRPTTRIVRISKLNDPLIEHINRILIEENAVTYLKVCQMLLTDKIGVHLEIKLEGIKNIGELRSKINFLLTEIQGVPIQELINNSQFLPGITFHEINPFIDFQPKSNSFNVTCITPDRKSESIIFRETVVLTLNYLTFLFKKDDAAVALNEEESIFRGLSINKTFNIDYGQKAKIITEMHQ